MDRRSFLGLGAGAAAFSLLPLSVRTAMAAAAPTGGLELIEHVVILMQENRSFDHYYGSLRGIRGFNDPNALTLSTGRSVFHQPCAVTSDLKVGHPNGYVLPYAVSDYHMAGTPHGWSDGHAAWAKGRNDAWVPHKQTNTMSGYRREHLAFYYALSEAFTICDAYHCSEMGPTNPNRNHLFSGMIGYEPGGTTRATGNAPYGNPNHTGYTWTTYAERLRTAGVSWRVYQEWDNFTDNSLEYFKTFVDVALKALAKTGYKKVEAFYDALRGASSTTQNTMLAQLAEGVATLTPAERALYDGALRRERSGGLLAAFKADVDRGTLPAVSWLVPNTAESEHSTNGPANGAVLTSKLLDVLASNQTMWNKTVFILNYDENDGFFDHVPAPTPPVVGDGSDGKSTVPFADEIVSGTPIGLGARVPMIVVSPWTRGGYVCSEVFDHTSVLKFLERVTGVAEPNITPWRRAVCGDLTSALDLNTAVPAYPTLPVPATSSGPRGTFRTPPSTQAFPLQEPGVRPARPLPYNLAVKSTVTAGSVAFDFVNSGTAGAHFSVYANQFRTDGPWRYTVEAGKSLSDTFTAGTPTGAYDLTAYGPNGFVRRFAGNRVTATSAGKANPEVTIRYAPAEGRVYLRMTNTGTAACVVKVVAGNRSGGPWTYPVAVNAVVEDYFSVAGTDYWYDLTATADTTDGFLRRFAGHVETGTASKSDPVMGSGRLSTVVSYVSSEETAAENGAARNAVDGTTSTIWHTRWSTSPAQPPHEIRLDLGSARTVTGLTYVPRQDGGANGRFGGYEVELSTDGSAWSKVTSGAFPDDAKTKTVRFWPSSARYVRVRVLSEAGGRGPWASAAELFPIGY
ncbi:phosphocholine-specific phospholipase C [Actinokineospora xionganensis]|uniref:phospholipase C n=1 Tax=Actinokineospora xionganensis TaxID=2684470 RepID=A0ABR7L437_9PSEU|nr:phospholipase C, phosphocholine-specific [Actinokineospora xionganensis]MBC6447429.1 phospholipase C, phosphocholine-specific [Actinokineospora xionganensis]